MSNNIPPNLQAALDNMSDEQIAEILNTKYTAADIAEQQKALEQLKEQLCNPKQVTIEGWVARDQRKSNNLNLHYEKPFRDYHDANDYPKGFWDNKREFYFPLPDELFPSVTWVTEPQKVRITITPIE